MKFLVVFISLFLTISVAFADAVIFSGADVKALKYNLDLFGRSKVMGLNVDPSAGAGVAAPLGSLGMDYLTGNVYYKKTVPNTGWISISNSVEGTAFQYAAYDVNGILNDLPGVSYVNNATQYYGTYYNNTAIAATVTEIRAGGLIDTPVDGVTANDYSAFVGRSVLGGTSATTIANIAPFAWFGTYDVNLTANNSNTYSDSSNFLAGAVVTDITSVNIYPQINQATMNQYKAFTSSVNVGNTDPAHLNGFTGLGLFDQMGSQSDLDGYTGVNISPNFVTGAVVDGYSSIAANPQFDVVGLNGYRAVQVGGNFGQNSATTVSNHIDFQSSPAYRLNATLTSYNGLSIGPSFEEGSTIDTATGIYHNMDVRGNVTSSVTGYASNNNLGDGTAPLALPSYQDININPNFGNNLTLTNYTGFVLRPNVVAGATVTNSVNLLSLGINSTLPVGTSATGIYVDMSNFQTPSSPAGLQVQNGGSQLSALMDTGIYPVQSVGGPYGLNNIGGTFHIASGFPITGGNFGIGNNLGIAILAEDDVPVDSSGLRLGFLMNGFLTQIGVANGKVVDSITFMGAGAQDAYPGGSTGTFDEINMFRALGILPTNGATINNIYGFKVDPMLSMASPANAWGVWVGDTLADNWFAKNVVIGGATGKTSFAAVGLEVNDAVIFQDVVKDNANVQAMETNVRELYDSTGTLRLNWNGTNIISDATEIRLDANGGNAQSIQFYDNTNTFFTGLKASTATANSVTYELPVDDGTNGQVLTTNGTGAMSWTSKTSAGAPTVQTFGAGSGTYTTPVGVTYIKVRVVGSGGGGSGTGSGAGGGSAGNASTFGVALLTANGAGAPGGTQGGTGGTATISAPAYGTIITGGSGTGYTLYQNPSGGVNTVYSAGGAGGGSCMGGGGGGGGQGSNGQSSSTQGSGGGGGSGEVSQTNNASGVGGGAGGCLEAFIATPAASYAYTVGGGGTGGAAGTLGTAGGNGGDGYIEVVEYY